jgi:SAM-dependent methyltransferase
VNIDVGHHPAPSSSALKIADLTALRCPTCKSGSLALAESLICQACETIYPVAGGVPVLINDGNSVFARADYQPGATAFRGDAYGKSTDAVPSGLRGAYHKCAGYLLNFAISRSHLDAEKALKRIQGRVLQPRILVIGAGDENYIGPGQFTYTDVAFSKKAMMICDAHDLPFVDEYFDFVIAVAVLEHVADPNRCADEIWRVLKPGACVYAATPFLQAVHMGAYDFTRFTYLGHRRLFRRFDDEESGMALGPGAALAWSVQYFMTSLTDHKMLKAALRLLSLVISLPLKLADYITRSKASAMDGAAGVFFFGPKRAHPLTDREVIGLYRGGY